MRVQPTAIERLGEEAEQYVVLRLDAEMRGQVTLEAICSEIRQKFGAEIPPTTLSSYKQRRYLRRIERLRKLKDFMEAAEKHLGDRSLSKSTQAELLGLFDEAMRAGAKLAPEFVLSERRKWAQLDLQYAQLEQDKKELESRIERFRQARQRERAAVKAAVAGAGAEERGKAQDELLRQIDEIYGTYQEAAAAALPSEVGGG